MVRIFKRALSPYYTIQLIEINLLYDTTNWNVLFLIS